MHAPHTTCPGCHEEIYLEELVRGRCPLCGCEMEDVDECGNEMEEILGKEDLSWLVCAYFIFRRLDSLGASPMHILQLLGRCNDGDENNARFSLEVPMGLLDRIRPRRCAKCGALHIRGGKKYVRGSLEQTMLEYSYQCRQCSVDQ